MAERRMFAKSIVNSDAFGDMPASSRLLYFRYGMEVDDDGFIINPKQIMRMSGASEDDIRVLVAKHYIMSMWFLCNQRVIGLHSVAVVAKRVPLALSNLSRRN